MTTPGGAADWSALCGSLPDHNTAVMDGYGGGQPSIAEQSRTHWALLIGGQLPAVDLGPDPGTVVG